VHRGWLGVRIQAVTDEIAESLGLDKAHGALVILTYDGKPVDRSRQLPRLVADSAPDKPVKLTIWRDGKEAEMTLTVVAYNPNRPQPQPPAPEQPKPPPTVDALGLKVAKLTPELRKQFSLARRARRASSSSRCRKTAPAPLRGLRAGDMIVVSDRRTLPVSSPDEVLQQIAAAKSRPATRTS
jgi:serine protease Do